MDCLRNLTRLAHCVELLDVNATVVMVTKEEIAEEIRKCVQELSEGPFGPIIRESLDLFRSLANCVKHSGYSQQDEIIQKMRSEIIFLSEFFFLSEVS